MITSHFCVSPNETVDEGSTSVFQFPSRFRNVSGYLPFPAVFRRHAPRPHTRRASMRRRPLAGLAILSTLATLALSALPSLPAAQAAAPTIASTSFETGADGWGPRGSAQVATSTALARTGASSLQVTGRTANWNGPAFNALGLLAPNVTYTMGAYVRLKPGAGTDKVSLTVQRDH